MPVCAGEFSTERGVSETNRVPRSRSSSTGRAVRRYGGMAVSSCSCCDRFAGYELLSLTAIPPYRLSAKSFTARPATLETHEAPRLSRGFRAAVGARGWLRCWVWIGLGEADLNRERHRDVVRPVAGGP